MQTDPVIGWGQRDCEHASFGGSDYYSTLKEQRGEASWHSGKAAKEGVKQRCAKMRLGADHLDIGGLAEAAIHKGPLHCSTSPRKLLVQKQMTSPESWKSM